MRKVIRKEEKKVLTEHKSHSINSENGEMSLLECNCQDEQGNKKLKYMKWVYKEKSAFSTRDQYLNQAKE